MAPRYDNISRAAYVFDEDAAPWVGQYRALDFPESWHSSVLKLCNLGRDPEDEPFRTAPTARFDGVLQTLAPDLVVRGRVRDRLRVPVEDYWLYVPSDAPSPLSGDTFDRLSGAWLRDLRPEPEHYPTVLECLRELRATPPTWHETPVDLLGCATTTGGTASPAARQYQLATDAVARRITRLLPYEFDGGQLKFRAVPRGPRQQGAELMSQPLHHEVKGRTWWFSIVIAVTLHTVPFDPRPRIHLHLSVRRWITHVDNSTGAVRLPYRTATSVYLAPSIPWLPGAPATDRYAVAMLARDRASGQFAWGKNGPARMLSRLELSRPFPDPQDLLTRPLHWIEDHPGPGVRAAIVHSTRMGSHGIGAGLMSHQRSQLIEWAEQAMPEGLSRVRSLRRSTAGVNTPRNVRPAPTGVAAKKAEQQRAADARRAALALAVRINQAAEPAQGREDDVQAAPLLEARLLWQTPSLRDAAIRTLAETLGLQGDGCRAEDRTDDDYYNSTPGSPVIHTWHTPELTVRLRCLRLTGGLADTLGMNPATRPKTKALTDAIAARRRVTAAFLTSDFADPQKPELALIEIDRRKDYAHEWDDPKYALRLGAADAGMLTQFVMVPKKVKGYNSEKNMDHRLRSGWQDGLRQLGVRVLPEHTLGGKLPSGLRYASLWMVKRRNDGPTRLPRHRPVAVMVSPVQEGTGLAVVTGWDEKEGTWVPYPKFLLLQVKQAEIPEIDSDDQEQPTTQPSMPEQRSSAPAASGRKRVTYRVWKQTMDEQRQDTARYLQKMIRSLRGHPTLLIAHAQNSRMHWPWLQDGQAEPDSIKTGHAPAAGLDPDLRIVRIRDADGRETPQWWGNAAPGGINGLPPGLWVDGQDTATRDRTFYSTTSKASTFRDSAVEANRIAPRPIRQGVNRGEPTIDAAIPAWNPALVEIVVMGCQADDSPEALALAAHQLRQAPDYLDALSTPLPMHLAMLAQHYVLPTIGEAGAEGADTGSDEPGIESEESIIGLGISAGHSIDADLTWDPELSDAPGLMQPPDESGEINLQEPLFALAAASGDA
ncbi:DUF3893 domain-containing protein [Micromonospora craterilacus]|uniref:DUF3893 domain-containing protein n=1 Tax=Micromonospora craterilacus TaxID=1655439 RepID=A0A2W2EEU8_9ACTN|nr:DUF3962 domain-containing protein [Micromonospora craterilacus]PZG12130.1 DUF3893 domain-containing protein [Micromonospora craterilacus]